MTDKVVLAYSGGLDTSIAIRWIKENYRMDVVALTVNVGGMEQKDLDAIRRKACDAGAVGAYVVDARQTFVGIWIRLLLEGKSFEVWGGEQMRDFTYVDDCVDALLLAATDERACGQVFNLGGADVYSLKDLAQLLIEVNGKGEYSIRSFPEERKKIDIGHYYSDFGLIRETLGWEPRIDLKEGLRRTLDYYRNYLPHYI